MLTFNNITADSFAADTSHGAGRRRPRHREALSCTQCRDRKVRCDRKQPCKGCQGRGLAASCSYASSREQYASVQPTPPARKPNTEPSSPSSSTSGDSDMRKRLERIESMLQAAGQAPTTPSETASHRRASSVALHTPAPPSITSAVQTGHGSPLSAKTRFIGDTHWLAVCNNMTIIKAMLNKAPEFANAERAFADIKTWTKHYNTLPPLSSGIPDISNLYSLLPARNVCESWIRAYAQSYRQVYDIVDDVTLNTAMSATWSSNHKGDDTLVAIILLVISVGMQAEESERLNGRRLARQVELYCLAHNILSRPCIGTMMVLLLLSLLKTICCSDTEPLDSLSNIMGMSSQVAMAMGLHRNPKFCVNITPYHTEVRRRLWGVFFRMNFEHSMRIGVPCQLREEDTTVGLPLNVNLDELTGDNSKESPVKELPKQTEATFSIIAAKLAFIAAPIQRQICSGGGLTTDSVRQLRDKIQTFLANAPPHMRPGAKTADPTEEIQQSFLTVTMHSISLLLSLYFVADDPPDISQKAHLLNIWDHALSVIHSFQVLTGKPPRIQTISYQLLWSETCRAAFSATMVLNRLRIIEMKSMMSTRPQHTLIPFQDSLMKYLTFMSRFWFKSAHLGPIVAKNCLLLAIDVAVTAKLFMDEEGANEKELLNIGARSVEQGVESMKMAMQSGHNYPMSPEASSSGSTNNMSPQLNRVVSNASRSTSKSNIATTWPTTSAAIEATSAVIPVTSAAIQDPFAQSIGTMFGHPFISGDAHNMGYTTGEIWPMDPYEFSNSQPSFASLTIAEKSIGTNPMFMDGLMSPNQEWPSTSQWIEDIGMQY